MTKREAIDAKVAEILELAETLRSMSGSTAALVIFSARLRKATEELRDLVVPP